jgi:hypothetical protein
MSIRVTQFGNEVWVKNPSNIRVTQFGNEVWVVSAAGKVRVTQIGIEVWRTVAGLPQTMTGHADGYATAYAISDRAQTTRGNADGYATASERHGKPLTGPIIALMGI